MKKKGQSGGLITALVFGVASLVIGIIIAFVIVNTLTDAELLKGGRTTATATESDSVGGVAFVNGTGYTLLTYDAGTTKSMGLVTIFASTDPRHSATAVALAGGWGYNYSIGLGNATTSSSGVVTNITGFNTTILSNVSITYTVTSESAAEASTDDLSANFTKGVNNVSSKIPTVLLIAAIVLILGVLAVLVGVWQRMKMGGASTL